MTQITEYKSVAIQTLMDNIERVKYNPSGIQRAIFDCLDEITSGEVNIVDPTNPFVFLLEASSVSTAVAITENMVNLRKQYPSLAQTEEDLYLHLSDDDFVNRFAMPSETDFTIVIQVNDLLNKMLWDASEKAFKVTVPRNTEFTIENITFTLQYPINIRRFDNGIVQISYDNSIQSPLQALSNNIIDYSVRKDPTSIDWLFFKVPVKQMNVSSAYFPIQQSSIFSNDLLFSDKFYFCRVYYKNNNSNQQWVELIVTHTDQVYDSFKPTAVLKVFSNVVRVFIPSVYITSGMVSGEVRVDIYTTKGELTINLYNYKLNAFDVNFKAIDEVNDVSEFSNALLDMSFYSYSDQFISGGSNGISFHDLRDRVLFNSLGDRQIPITNVQLDAYVSNKGFELVKNTDVVTNRIFLATQKLPAPLNKKLITSANIGINTIIIKLDKLTHQNTVVSNGLRKTILSSSLYVNRNNIITMLTKTEVDALYAISKADLVAKFNEDQYLYSPFHYVLDDTSAEFEVRVYNLDYPTSGDLNFISQNQSLQLPVNTGTYILEKVSSGYKLTITTKSGSFYKQLADTLVGVQLAFKPNGENNLAYINGTLLTTNNVDERVYEFLISTNYDIDNNDCVSITNAKMFTNENIIVKVDLSLPIEILYTTTSVTDTFVPDDSTYFLGKFMLPTGSVCVTHETIVIKLGDNMKNLWTRSRSFSTSVEYDTYQTDVPLTYDSNVYETDPITNSIFTVDVNGELQYQVMHTVGEAVVDTQGNPVYKHRAGDVILVNDKAISTTTTTVPNDKELDMLFIDGRYRIADDTAFISYRDEIVSVLDTWILNDLKDVQALLLEQTKIFYFPQTTLGYAKVYADSKDVDFIKSEQSLILDLYVKNGIYSNPDMRTLLTRNSIVLIDSYMNKNTVNITEITLALKTMYNDSVISFSLSNLGGSNNYNLINLANGHSRLSLKKIAVLQQDNTIIATEDLVVNFYNCELPI